MTEEMLRQSIGSGQVFDSSVWNLKIWDAMGEVVDFLTKPFQILFSIPLGYGDATVMHFMIGIGIIGIAIFFFWRSASDEVGSYAGSTMQRDRAERESFNPRTTVTRSGTSYDRQTRTRTTISERRRIR